MPTFLFELRQRSNADADRKHADDEPLNGAHAEENCTAAEEAGLPSASATWLARIGKCDAALRFPHVARPSSRRARERAMDGVDSSQQEAESCAPCDEEGDNRRG